MVSIQNTLFRLAFIDSLFMKFKFFHKDHRKTFTEQLNWNIMTNTACHNVRNALNFEQYVSMKVK